ncbi:MAG TPA: thioredoxin domain-containing protein [Bacteroidales bacterium]|nr:thioredoxin domain-containing protein [Bacteroidales bacterium]
MRKRLSYLIAGLTVVSMIACKGQTASDKSTNETTVAASTGNDPAPVHLTRDQFLKQVMNYEKNPNTWVFEGDKPCLVDFYADWCAPCRITSPILEDLAKQYAGKINFYKVDVDNEQELASVFGIQSIPTFLFCPLEGDPTISTGIANTPAATKAMFIKQIEELLLKSNAEPTI